MNITDYIVAYLKQGKTAELPGIGTFATELTTAHYDSDDGTFSPTHETLSFSTATRGDKGVVQFIAEQECVGADTAEKMFRNYLDVLQAKLAKEHSHTFPGIGTLRKEGIVVSFQSDAKLNLDDATMECPTLTNVKIYHAAADEDPFAQFEQEFKEAAPAAVALEVATDKKAEDLAFQLDAEPAGEGAEPLEGEETSEDTVSRTAALDELDAAEQAMRDLKAHLTTPPVGQEASAESGQADEQAEPADEELPEADATAEEEPVNEKDTAYEASVEAENLATKAEAKVEVAGQPADEALSSLEKLEGIPSQKTTAATPKKKKRHPLLIIIIVLLVLCLLGGAGYYYLKIYQPTHTEAAGVAVTTEAAAGDASEGDAATTADAAAASVSDDGYAGEEESSMAGAAVDDPQGAGAEEQETTASSSAPASRPASGIVKANNDFTLATNNIVYTSDDVVRLSGEVTDYLRPYVARYLQNRRYGKAGDFMMQKVRQYAERRMGETLSAQGYRVQDFLNYCGKDYMHAYYEKDLKAHHSARQRVAVQRELMDAATLDKLLKEVLDENDVRADAAAPAAPRPAQPRADARAASKNGFDVIAGFYVNRAGADRMAGSLKKKGCDAYIINRDGLYYVSMGSAGSQTAAEALYHHIKEWYKGDVAIKKW